MRLQSGLPLNAQETRDAWPGQFTEFVLALGGKPELARYPGHPFFQNLMGLNPITDRGKARQFAAQICMLFFSHRANGSASFPDINATGINEFYFSNIDFDKSSQDAKRLIEILDKLNSLLGHSDRPKLKAHDAMHLVLLADSIWDDYTRAWEKLLPAALDKFMEGLASAKAEKDSKTPNQFWIRYGQWTRVNSDRGERIAHRHAFYTEKMRYYLGTIQLKDTQRAFGELEREIIFFRDKKVCAVCDAQVNWNEAEIHHVIEHSQGGKTVLENGVLVHKACHPKSESQTKALAEKLLEVKSTQNKKSDIRNSEDLKGYLWASANTQLFIPDRSEIRMSYKGKDYLARVEVDKIIYDGQDISPASLAKQITGTKRNAWLDLWIKFPNDDAWRLANDLRSSPDILSVDDL